MVAAKQNFTPNNTLSIPGIVGLANNGTAVSTAFDNTIPGYLSMEAQFSLAANGFPGPNTNGVGYANFYLLISVDGGTTYDDSNVTNAAQVRPQYVAIGPDGFRFSVDIEPVPQHFKFMVQNTSGAKYSVAEPWGICNGPDGNLWITDGEEDRIWQVTTSGVMRCFFSDDDFLFDIVTGPDGSLWYSDAAGAGVQTLTPAGAGTFYPLPSGGGTSASRGICVGPDNNLWLGDNNGNVWKVTTAGVGTSFALASSAPWGICSGPDGNLWVADGNASIWKVTTAGVPTQYALAGGSVPYYVCTGSDSNLWVTDNANARVFKVTTGGVSTPYTLAGSTPQGICSGPDGNLWVADASGAIWKVTTAGVPTKYAFAGTSFNQICVGSDNNLWATDKGNPVGAGNVWKITTGGIGTPNLLTLDNVINFVGKNDFYHA